MYVYFIIKSVVRWSENSVRFEKPGNWIPDGPNSVRLYLTVRYGMYGWCLHLVQNKSDFKMKMRRKSALEWG